jgi:parallel beta-helix repeat protein
MFSDMSGRQKTTLLKSILFIAVLLSATFSANSFANASTYYTVSASGSVFTTKNPSGSTLYSGSNAASAINKALSSVPSGGTVYIYGGTYPCSSQLVGTKSSITVTGDKTAIIQASASMGYLFLWLGTSSSHVTGLKISNLVFDCNFRSAGLGLKWCNNCIINSVEIRNTVKTKGINGLEAIGTSSSPNIGITVTNSYIHNIYGSGIAAAYTTDSTISSNTFVDCAQYYPSGGAIHPDGGCQRFKITNNNISGRSDNDGIYMGCSSSFASGCIITGNTINLRLYGTGGGKYYAGSGIKVYTLGAEISGNTINWNGTPYVYGISDWGQSNIIKNNVINGAAVGIGDNKVYYSSGSRVITGNTISNCKIGISLTQSGSTVTYNTLTNDATPIQNYGSNKISGNTIK